MLYYILTNKNLNKKINLKKILRKMRYVYEIYIKPLIDATFYCYYSF